MLTVVRNIAVIDGTGGPVLEDQTVVFEDGIIREVGREFEARATADVAVIDGRGKTLLPGLMDMHIHLNLPINPYELGSPECPVTDQSVAKSAVHALDNCRDLVAQGVLTVRDVGSHGHGIFAIKRLIDTQRMIGPRIYACGRAIQMTGGHGPQLSVIADGPDEVRRQARIQMYAGAELIKFMASGAAAEPGEDPYDLQLTEAEMAAGVVEANGRGRTTAAHAVNPQSVINAVRAGIDSIEHGVLVDETALQLMREHQTHLVPTIWTFQMLATHGSTHGTPCWVMRETEKRVETHLANVSRARELGVPVATGTDSCLPVNPAESMYWEMEWLRHCGYSRLEAIRAATLSGAELLEIDDRTGSIHAGKAADLLIVEGDPSRDLSALRNPHLVFKGGQIVARNGRAEDVGGRLILDTRNPPPGPLPPLEG